MVARRDELARTRRASGFTQETLAEALDVDVKTVGNWEAGKTEPQLGRSLEARASGRVSYAELEPDAGR
jgi:DNA-binding XRE family transcriptional regulator